ncbi:MAG: metallophosphoesterase [Lachnospiraceae bacterium]
MGHIYVMSDVHGNYEKYKKMLEKIHFSEDDLLYMLGDVLDRGEASMKVLNDMMLHANILPIIGNHEYMAMQCLTFLMTEVTEESIAHLDSSFLQGMLEWQSVGGQSTIEEFQKLSMEQREDILDYLGEFTLYEEVVAGGKKFVLVHAGLSNFQLQRSLDAYDIFEMIFEKPDYSKVYFPDKYLVTGHTPTRLIPQNPNPDFIYQANHHIAIDCGCGYDGQLGCICLDTRETYYT